MRDDLNAGAPVFVAMEEGAAAVVRAARHRRLRQASVGFATAVVVVGGSLGYAASNRAVGTDRLNATNGEQHPSPHPSPAVGPSHFPRNLAHPPASTAGGGAHPGLSQPANASPVQPRVAVGPAQPPPSPPSTHWAPPHRVSPITRSNGTIGATDVCRDDATDAGTGWCVRYTGPSTARRGHNVTLSGELCRLSPFSAATVRFSTTREVDLEVANTGNGNYVKLWRAGEGVRYRSPGRTVTLPGGSCLRWSSVWDTRDENGFVVPPGDYNVSLAIESNQFLSSLATSITVTD